jgi:Emfourin
MKLMIKKTGGFAGIERTLASLDTERMPKASADQVRQHVEDLSTLAAQTSESGGADQFQYEINVTEPGLAPRALTFIDEGDPNHPAMKHVAALLAFAGTNLS